MRNLRNFMFECTVQHSKEVIAKCASFQSDVDIYNMLSRFTLDCFTAIAFGQSVNSTSSYPKEHPFAEAFDGMISCVTARHIVPPWIWKAMRAMPFKVGNEGAIKRNMRVINAFADEVLDSRQHALQRITDESGVKYNDIISLYSTHDPSLSREQLKHIAMNMIIAGRDTTRLILSWCFYEMCQRPEIKAKVFAEIDEYAERNGAEMSYEDIGQSLRYTECVLLETLRLHPVVPFLARHCVKDTKLPTGHVIREGNEVMIHSFAYGRNPNIWREPLRFDPGRYCVQGKDPVNVHSVYEYPFFNVNPRLCLGRRLALMESKVFLFYFCRHFDFEMVDPEQDVRIKTGIVLNMVDGLRLRLKSRV